MNTDPQIRSSYGDHQRRMLNMLDILDDSTQHQWRGSDRASEDRLWSSIVITGSFDSLHALPAPS